MKPDTPNNGNPAVEYLIKEVSFSTCDNKFFGELEDAMLIPNNVTIYGKVKYAESLKHHQLNLDFPSDASIGYIKQPLANSIKDNRRVLTYDLEDLVNYENYWWFPVQGETEFSLRLNLLPPFPDLKPVELQMTCRPDVAVGLQTDVKTNIRIEAKEDIDQAYLKMTAPLRSMPGLLVAITKYSDDPTIHEPTQTVTSPRRTFPFPRLTLAKGQAKDYEVTTHIEGDPLNMGFLKCEQDILAAKLLTMSESSPDALPCGVTVTSDHGVDLPINRTVKSTTLQATAQVMYSPFSIRREPEKRPELLVPAA